MKKLLKQILKKTPIYPFIDRWLTKRWKIRELALWESTGRPVPPPHCIKERALIQYASTYGLKILVETGTACGEMVEAMKNVFTRIYSIELSEEMHRNAQKKFSRSTHIEIIHGDSGVMLKGLMSRIDQPALFWLDGHYSGTTTAKGAKDTPIYEELEHLFNAPDRGHVILIDDARCFGSAQFPSYPSINELTAFINAKRNNLEITVQDDIIRVTPKRQ